MKNELTNFQIILLAVFGFFIVAGVLFFALYRGGADKNLPPLILWGTYPSALMSQYFNSDIFTGQPIKFTYVEKNEATIAEEFTESLADGQAPDLLILPQSLLMKEQSRLLVIPYEQISERDFKDTYIEGAEIFLTTAGTLGIPFSVDPLVMYWNRTLYTNAGIAAPPKTWDEFFGLVPKLSTYDEGGNIRRSAVALGAFQNISNAKEILAALLMQAGTPIVTYRDERFQAVLTDDFNSGDNVAEAALTFYTQFADAAKGTYSWNRALPMSLRAFVDGSLSTYFGLASEIYSLRERNPNLNYDVAALPQLKNAAVKLTYGKMTALVIPRLAKDPQASLNGAILLGSKGGSQAFVALSGLPPIRRDLLAGTRPQAAYQDVFYQGALISRAWRDPLPSQSTLIFKNMVESITSGSQSLEGAISTANAELNDIIVNN